MKTKTKLKLKTIQTKVEDEFKKIVEEISEHLQTFNIDVELVREALLEKEMFRNEYKIKEFILSPLSPFFKYKQILLEVDNMYSNMYFELQDLKKEFTLLQQFNHFNKKSIYELEKFNDWEEYKEFVEEFFENEKRKMKIVQLYVLVKERMREIKIWQKYAEQVKKEAE